MDREEDLIKMIYRIGYKYLKAPKPLKITIGEILMGKIDLNHERNKKSDDHK
jgi:hypothetical protein